MFFYIVTVAARYNDGGHGGWTEKLWFRDMVRIQPFRGIQTVKSLRLRPVSAPFVLVIFCRLNSFLIVRRAWYALYGGRHTRCTMVVSRAAGGCRTITFWA